MQAPWGQRTLSTRLCHSLCTDKRNLNNTMQTIYSFYHLITIFNNRDEKIFENMVVKAENTGEFHLLLFPHVTNAINL